MSKQSYQGRSNRGSMGKYLRRRRKVLSYEAAKTSHQRPIFTRFCWHFRFNPPSFVGNSMLSLGNIECRHNAVPLATRANLAPFGLNECSIKLAPQSAFTRPATLQSQA